MNIDPNLNILVVDDFATMRKIVKNLLQDIGLTRFDEADDGATAWPKVKTGKYDLIVSDWNMPKMSGIELLKRVRSTPELKDTAFLMITAEAKKGQILEAAQAGVDGYIVKPFSVETLHAKLSKVLDRYYARIHKKAS